MKKALSLLLCILMCIPAAASCAEKQTDSGKAVNNVTQAETEAETEAPDPFADFDYEGKDFRVYTSANAASNSLQSSNYLIEGPEELTGDVAADAAFDRNVKVAEMLNINYVFTQANYGYDGVKSDVSKYILAADDAYDLIINDMYGITGLTAEGYFYNVLDGKYFDFTQPYYYSDVMEDVAINTNYQYMIAGDYFIDLLRSSHCLVFNKNLYSELFGQSSDLYNTVTNDEWTLDEMITLVGQSYDDINGNGKVDKEDRFGFICHQDWGPSIPFLISTDPGYIERDDEGYPYLIMNNERMIKMCDTMYKLWNTTGTGALNVYNNNQADVLNTFTSGNSLIIGYIQLGSLESDYLRSTEYEIGVIPYPKLDSLQEKYITSVHDTSELGVLPVTLPETELDYISAVIEVLNRETYKDLLPKYYETALKVKYTRDDESAAMIDLIHDNIGNTFPLAWHSSMGSFLQSVVHAAMMTEGSFSSKYAAQEKTLNKQLDSLIEVFKAKSGN